MRRILSNDSIQRRATTLLLALVGVVLMAGAAQARSETVEWSQGNMTNVVGWKLYVGSSPGVYGTPIDVQLPTPDSGGTYAFQIDVPGGDPVYVAMTSYNAAGEESILSNERMKVLTTGGAPDMSSPYWID